MIKAIAIIAVWVVALAAIPARDILFSGKIYVWPFLLGSCVIAALYNWKMAAVIAVAVIGDQFLQRTLLSPETVHVMWFAVVAVIAFGLIDKTAAAIAASVSLCYLYVVFGGDWRVVMIVSEVLIILGLCIGMLIGPTGGLFHGDGFSVSGIGRVGRSAHNRIYRATDFHREDPRVSRQDI